jgi:hypothetical protein
MYIQLDEGRVTNAMEAMDLPGLDDKNVTRAGFEFLSVDGPQTPAFRHELDFIVRMTMGPRTTPGESAEEKHGDIYVAVIGPNESVRAALKGEIFLTDAVHPADAPARVVTANRETDVSGRGLLPLLSNFHQIRSQAPYLRLLHFENIAEDGV